MINVHSILVELIIFTCTFKQFLFKFFKLNFTIYIINRYLQQRCFISFLEKDKIEMNLCFSSAQFFFKAYYYRKNIYIIFHVLLMRSCPPCNTMGAAQYFRGNDVINVNLIIIVAFILQLLLFRNLLYILSIHYSIAFSHIAIQIFSTWDENFLFEISYCYGFSFVLKIN